MNNELQLGDCEIWPPNTLLCRLHDGGVLAFQHSKGAFNWGVDGVRSCLIVSAKYSQLNSLRYICLCEIPQVCPYRVPSAPLLCFEIKKIAHWPKRATRIPRSQLRGGTGGVIGNDTSWTYPWTVTYILAVYNEIGEHFIVKKSREHRITCHNRPRHIYSTLNHKRRSYGGNNEGCW